MTTQFAKASYQEVIDLHTESDTVSVIGIHTPQGDTPRKMFGGFYDQFKKFKYLGCSVSLVPAARLPADPLQVSLAESGDPTIDPRDMLNPLMFHGCHGNDMGVILNRFYNANSLSDIPQSDSTFFYADSFTDVSEGDHISGLQLEDLYYKALTDNTWKKAHPQRGFKKGGLRPLVYSMATNMQFNGSSIAMADFGIPEDSVDDVSTSGQNVTATFPVSQSGRRFFTPRLTGLGWLDTRNVLTTAVTVTGSTADLPAMFNDAALQQQDASEADLPLVYMGMILLPPAYKTEQYFRMIINHHFAFKDFRGISFSNSLVESPAYDNFNEDEEGPISGVATAVLNSAAKTSGYVNGLLNLDIATGGYDNLNTDGLPVDELNGIFALPGVATASSGGNNFYKKYFFTKNGNSVIVSCIITSGTYGVSGQKISHFTVNSTVIDSNTFDSSVTVPGANWNDTGLSTGFRQYLNPQYSFEGGVVVE